MKIIYFLIYSAFYGISLMPFWFLHRCSDFLYLIVYRVWGYRKKVVRENLKASFPEKSEAELLKIEKLFFRNFCDLVMETIKTFSISEKELLDRCKFTNPGFAQEMSEHGVSMIGISSHLANWEWLGLSLGVEFGHSCFALYKPLSNSYINELILKTRTRFGTTFVSIKRLKEVFQLKHDVPILIGLLSDQAPHDYSRAFEIQFLNQKTYVVPGPGVLTAQYGYMPIWGWMRRVGRSRYEWGVEMLESAEPTEGWSSSDREQMRRIQQSYPINDSQAAFALGITQEFNRRLEKQIKMAPQDWLWSHRRWKKR